MCISTKALCVWLILPRRFLLKYQTFVFIRSMNELIDLNTCVFIQRVNKAWLYGAIPVLPEKDLQNLVLEHALVYVTLKH